MVAEGIKVLPTIFALLDAADPLFICLSNKVIIQELIYLTCIFSKLGAAYWYLGNSFSYAVSLEVCITVKSCLNPYDV